MILFLRCGKCYVEESVLQVKFVNNGPLSLVADPFKDGWDEGVAESEKRNLTDLAMSFSYEN